MDSRRLAPAHHYGQHFLRSRETANELVRLAKVRPGTLVVEVGAGKGIITRAVADIGAEAMAVELDPRLADSLRDAFASTDNVTVICGNILHVVLPSAPWQAIGNIPFNVTTRLLRRLLDDPGSALVRADLIVQRGAAAKRAARRPSNLLNICWGPWWTFTVAMDVPAWSFRPPSVEGAMLSIERRAVPLVQIDRRRAFHAFVRHGFTTPCRPLRFSLSDRLSPKRFKRLAGDLGFRRDARPIDLDVRQWAALFHAASPPRQR